MKFYIETVLEKHSKTLPEGQSIFLYQRLYYQVSGKRKAVKEKGVKKKDETKRCKIKYNTVNTYLKDC